LSTDERTQKRRENQERAHAEAERGPARARQDAAPILDAISRFYEEDTIRFGIPAHKGGAGAPANTLEALGAGRISAELVTPYPPGIPLIVPGERITGEIVDYLLTGAAEGFHVEGASDTSLERLRVVAS
jgi:arginine/lysine/ornithine decarboxylase